jgi:hypothetical protein
MNRLKLLLALFVFTGFSALMAQTRTITGTVTSQEDGLAVPGASVTVKGTTLGAQTDADGFYSLTVPQNAETLVVNFIGMKKTEVPIEGRSRIDVVLTSEVVGLEEVVVTA